MREIVAEGLQMLLCLRLPGGPAAETMVPLLRTWMLLLTTGSSWQESRDAERLRQAFVIAGRELDHWPSVADFRKQIPPVPQEAPLLKLKAEIHTSAETLALIEELGRKLKCG
jgi:hypothetical protein